MKVLSTILISTLLLLSACQDGSNPNFEEPTNVEEREQLVAKIEKQQEAILNSDLTLDRSQAVGLLGTYIEFINSYPDDKLKCDYTLKAAKLAQGLERYRQSIELYQNVFQGCPEHEMYEESAFMIAVIYHNFLNDRETAKKHYEQFIDDFPDHPLASDAKAMMELLYLTDDQIIERFQQNNSSQ